MKYRQLNRLNWLRLMVAGVVISLTLWSAQVVGAAGLTGVKNKNLINRANEEAVAQATGRGIPRPEYPRPDFVRAEWLNLNGEWDFALDLSDSGEERGLPEGQGFDRKILVPFAPESSLSGVGYLDFMPAVWYKKVIRIPEKWKGKRILLNFEAADYRTTVWVNGNKVGENSGGYAPFSFDITDFCHRPENLLVVRCQDYLRSNLQPSGKQSKRYHSYSCLYRRTTGLWQTVWLEPVPSAYVEEYRVYPDVDNGQAVLMVKLAGATPEDTLELEVKDGGKVIFQERKKAGTIISFEVKIDRPRLWEIRKPYLYDFTLELKKGKEQSLDRVQGYFGLRKIEARGEKIYFNNRPLFLRTVLDQGFYPDGIYTAPSDEALRRDIELSLACGFDGARLHQRVFERRFLYWADKLGYLVWGEFADWGLDLSRPESLLIFQREWEKVVLRDFNHPSVIGWCPFNEQWGEEFPGVMERIFSLTKKLDPTRLVIDASGGYHVVIPDVYDSHNYEQNVQKFKAVYDGLLETPPGAFANGDPKKNTPYRGQPYFVSEYGGIWWNPGQKDDKAWGYGERPRTAEEFLERYRGLTEALLFNPKIAGFCYTQLYDIEQEVNGLYTFDRQPKFDPAYFFKVNQQKAAIEK